jgi:hypothetical protein
MIRDYILLAVGCFFIGVVIALATIAVCIRLHISIMGENIWILAIPAMLALALNIALIELYRKFKKKK